MAANVASDYTSAEASWTTFINSAFESSLDIDYQTLTYFNSYFDSQNGGDIFSQTSTCSNATLSNEFIVAIKTGSSISMVCDDHEWNYDNERVCVDCDPADPCTSGNVLAVIPPSSSCAPALSGRAAAALHVTFEVIYPADIPGLNEVSASSTKTTITVATNVTAFTTGGTLFCAAFAFANADITISNGLIKQDGVSTFVQTSSDNEVLIVEQTISNLIPIQLYTVYCYTESIERIGITFDEVEAKSQLIFTQCCRSVAFTNAPNFVYNEVAQYSSADASSKYVFSYVLAAPDYDVDITPLLLKNTSGNVENISGLSQGLVTYLPDSDLTSSFVLSAVSDLTNTDTSIGALVSYMIDFEIGGDDAFMYDAPRIELVVGNGESEPPTPVFTTGIIAGTGATATLTFDSETDKAVTITSSASWSCNLLLVFNGASLCTCSFSSTSTIKITFPAKSQISETTTLLVTGESVELQADRVKALCTSSASVCASSVYSYASSTSVVVSAPVVAKVPVVAFSMPSIISNCDDLRVDASSSSGSAGRPFTSLVIEVTATNGIDVTALQANMSTHFSSSGVSSPYLIDNSYLTSAVYSFKLSLTNWLGETATGSKTVEFSTEGDLPTLTISGSNFITTTAANAISVSAIGKLSGCSKASGLSYDPWTVFLDFVFVNGLTSVSNDPRKFTLPAYTFSAGKTYQISLTTNTIPISGGSSSSATTTATIFVDFSVVTVTVTGGYNREVPIDTVLKLDASSSVDTSYSATSQTDRLSYLWTCVEHDVATFGTSCSSLIIGASSSFATVSAGSLTEGSEYVFTIKCTSTDGTARTSSKTVLVTGSAGNTPTVSILTTVSKFNPSDSLTVVGFIEANLTSNPTASVNAFWNATGFSNLNDVALVSAFRQFSGVSTLASGVSFQLAFAANIFTAGDTYTFKLTSYITDSLTSAAFLDLEVNSPPVSGSFNVTPTSGIATGSNSSTQFFFTSPDWLDEDLPLTYEMLYYTNVNDPSATFTIQAKSVNSIAFSKLPAGVESSSFNVFCFAYVRDSLSALTETDTALVSARLEDGISATEAAAKALADSLSNALSTADSDAVTQAVNTAASTLSTVNCSLATNCDSLFRFGCTVTAQTCGSCLDGYIGEDGDANTACELKSNRRLIVERMLTSNANCPLSNIWYYNTSDPDCAPFDRVCPTDSTAVCSGHGACKYQDVSGNAVDSCTVVNQFCSALCECEVGYGGNTCGYTDAEIESRLASRQSMCDAIVFSSSLQDSSPELLLSMATSLGGVYDPMEVVSADGIASCELVLETIFELLVNGQLDGTDQTTQVVLGALSSLTTTVGISPGNTPSNFSSLLVSVVDRLVENVVEFMVPGQTIKTFLTDNIQLTVYSEFVSDTTGASLVPPQTTTEQSLALPSTLLVLPENGWDQCVSDSDSISYSVLTWKQNPFANSNEISSPLLHVQLLNASARVSDPESTASSSYSIVFQLTEEQSGNMNASDVTENRTIPECTRRDGDAYGSCSCTVSAYTSRNVTLTCSDVTDLCGGSSSTADSSSVNTAVELFTDLSLDGANSGVTTNRRRLSSSTDSSSSSQLGLLFTATAGVVSSTLSVNPTALASASLPVLIFMFTLFGVFVIGCVVFSRIDEQERLQLTYIDNALLYVKNVETAQSGRTSALNRAFSAKSLGKGKSKSKSRLTSPMKPSPQRSKEEFDFSEQIFKNSEDLVDTHVDSEYVDQVDSFFGNVVFKGSNEVSVISEGHFWAHYGISLVREHLLLAPFSYASTNLPRFFRWMEVFCDTMLNLVLSAVFFSIFYPGTANCAQFTTVSTCEDVIVSATGETQCMFDAVDGSCTERPPPESATFFLLLTLCIAAITLPLLLPTLVCIDIIRSRPDLEAYDKFPWSIVKFCVLGGADTNEVVEATSERPSMLKGVLESEMDFKSAISAASRASDAATDAAKKATDAAYDGLGKGFQKVKRASISAGQKLNLLKHNSRQLSGKQFFGQSLQAKLEYASSLSSSEEAKLIVEDSIQYLSRSFTAVSIPWYAVVDSHAWKDDFHVTAIQELLQMYPDGSLVPLTLYERVILGYRSPLHRLEVKVREARKKAKKLVAKIEDFSKGENDLKDKLLLQSFILENMSSLDGSALKKSFFNFDNAARPIVSLPLWLFGWTVVIGELLFCTYFALAWAVSNDPQTIRFFFIVFCLNWAQDMMLFESLRVFCNFTIPLATMKPQLRRIYHVLNNIMTSEESMDLHGEADQELQIVQFLSATCRAARSEECGGLPASSFLIKLTDADSAKCLRLKIHKGWILTLLLAAPAFYALMGELRGDEVFNIIIQVVYTFLVLVNELLMSYSVALAIALYCGVVVYIMFHYKVYKPMRARLKMERELGPGNRGSLWDTGDGHPGESDKLPHGDLGQTFATKVLERLMRFYLDTDEAKGRRRNCIWHNMNKPYHTQAYVLSPTDHGHYESLLQASAEGTIDIPDFVKEIQCCSGVGMRNRINKFAAKVSSPSKPNGSKSPVSSPSKAALQASSRTLLGGDKGDKDKYGKVAHALLGCSSGAIYHHHENCGDDAQPDRPVRKDPHTVIGDGTDSPDDPKLEHTAGDITLLGHSDHVLLGGDNHNHDNHRPRTSESRPGTADSYSAPTSLALMSRRVEHALLGSEMPVATSSRPIPNGQTPASATDRTPSAATASQNEYLLSNASPRAAAAAVKAFEKFKAKASISRAGSVDRPRPPIEVKSKTMDPTPSSTETAPRSAAAAARAFDRFKLKAATARAASTENARPPTPPSTNATGEGPSFEPFDASSSVLSPKSNSAALAAMERFKARSAIVRASNADRDRSPVLSTEPPSMEPNTPLDSPKSPSIKGAAAVKAFERFKAKAAEARAMSTGRRMGSPDGFDRMAEAETTDRAAGSSESPSKALSAYNVARTIVLKKDTGKTLPSALLNLVPSDSTSSATSSSSRPAVSPKTTSKLKEKLAQIRSRTIQQTSTGAQMLESRPAPASFTSPIESQSASSTSSRTPGARNKETGRSPSSSEKKKNDE